MGGDASIRLRPINRLGRPARASEEWRRFERFVEVRQNLPDWAWLGDERDEPDVAAARWALERKLLPHPRYQLGPRNLGSVVGAELCMCATAIPSIVPAVRDISLLTDVADRQRCDGRPQRVVGGDDPVIAMPVPPRLWNEIGEPIEELKRRGLDHAARARLRRFS